MNNPTHPDNLKRMLEAATAADPPLAGSAPADEYDAETASLREAWLALGQLVRAADESLPPAPKITPSRSAAAAAVSPRKRPQARWAGLTAAAAATLLIALVCGWWIHRYGAHGKQGLPVAQDAPNEAATPLRTTGMPPASIKPEQPKVERGQPRPRWQKPIGPLAGGRRVARRKHLRQSSTWDDPLETQIASVSREISTVEQSWQHRVDDVDLVQYRIDEVTDSLQNDKL